MTVLYRVFGSFEVYSHYKEAVLKDFCTYEEAETFCDTYAGPMDFLNIKKYWVKT